MSIHNFLKFLFLVTVGCLINHVDSEQIARMVGGHYAKQGDFTYQVSVQSNHRHFCGGALISDQHVLTAAHCMVNRPNNRFYDPSIQGPLTIKAGVTKLDDPNFVYAEVQEIVVSNYYMNSDKLFYVYDFAILKLRTRINVHNNPRVSIVNLPGFDTHKEYAGLYANVAGWGSALNLNTNQLYQPRDLLALTLEIWDTNRCNNIFQGNLVVDKQNQICGYAPRSDGRRYGTCQGDSGSPLVIDNTVIGVASSAPQPCGRDNVPSVFARISAYIPFIRNIMAGRYSDLMAVKRF